MIIFEKYSSDRTAAGTLDQIQRTDYFDSSHLNGARSPTWGPFNKRFRAGIDTAPCKNLMAGTNFYFIT